MITVVTVSNADQALLIILSIFLAFFLVLSIITLIWILQILKDIKRMIRRAEELAAEANEGITKFFNKTTPVFALVNLLSNLFGGSKNDDDRRKK